MLTEGRISLRVLTEVSELSNENALTLTQSIGAGQTSSLTVPSIKTRRAETTVEIPSGGSLALAGMIHEQTKQQLNGMPGLMNIPVLGALFKSRDYVNRQTELVVLVTPYVVRAVAQKDIAKPDDGYADASDASGTLLGRFNRLYGVPGRPIRRSKSTAATTASFSTRRRDEERSMKSKTSTIFRRRALAHAVCSWPASRLRWPAATPRPATPPEAFRPTIAPAIRS